MVSKSTLWATAGVSAISIPVHTFLSAMSPMAIPNGWDNAKPEMKVIFVFSASSLPVVIILSGLALVTDDPRFLALHMVPFAGSFGGSKLVSTLNSSQTVKDFAAVFDRCASQE